MPVFHTKTINSILEPVANQVSQLVIFHEEAEAGKALPDLSAPVHAVGTAVNNLVGVGRETAATSKDEILKQEMPVAFQRVEESSKCLIESTQLIKKDPFSVEARKKLLTGARGILSGTSTLLLTFDDAEVRKIVSQCKNVMDYLQIGEMVEVMEDVVTFVKNVTPGITRCMKSVQSRQKELTHKAHVDLLERHIQSLKSHMPLLIGAMKTFVLIISEGRKGRPEAQENRNYLLVRMTDDLIEIIRVLKLKVFDESEAEDPTTEMRTAQERMGLKLQYAKDWLANPSADANGLGEKAVHDFLDEAKRIGEMSGNQEILRLHRELAAAMDRLSDLRAKGLGSSPEALALSQDIAKKLDLLQDLVDQTIQDEIASGSRLPAQTNAGRVEQATSWIKNPKSQNNDIGKKAIDFLVRDAQHVAESVQGTHRTEILKSCDKIIRLTKELAALKAQGKGNSPEAKAKGEELEKELKNLQSLLADAVTNSVVDDFMDVKSKLVQLDRAANAPADQPDREPIFEQRAGDFEYGATKMIVTARNVATNGKGANTQLSDNIKVVSRELAALTPQVSHAGKLLLLNPGNPQAEETFRQMKNEWSNKADELVGLVDAAIDAPDFIEASENAIKKDFNEAQDCIEAGDPEAFFLKTNAIAHRAKRVAEVAEAEAENSENPTFTSQVMVLRDNLTRDITPVVVSSKTLIVNIRDPSAKKEFVKSTNQVIMDITEMKEAFKPEPPLPEPPIEMTQLSLDEAAPPRPPPPVVAESQDMQQAHALLAEPPADNRMAVAAHHLHTEATKWSEEGNAIIQAAKRLAVLFAKMSKFVGDDAYGEQHSKKELIDTAKLIAISSQEVCRLANEVSKKCADKRLRSVLQQTLERIPTTGTQLKILATVKATMFGAKDPKADQEATEMLVGCAENLMSAVRQTVRETEAASIKIRTDEGSTLKWQRQTTPRY